MKSKLDNLVYNENLGIDSINCETGVMMNQYNDLVVYIFLEYEDYFEVYLGLHDEEPPFRDILAKGTATTLEEAKAIAVNNLNELAYGQIIN